MNHFSNSVCCLTCCVLVLRDCSSSDAYCFSASFTSASVKLRSDTFCTHTWMYFLWGRVKAGSRISQDKKKKNMRHRHFYEDGGSPVTSGKQRVFGLEGDVKGKGKQRGVDRPRTVDGHLRTDGKTLDLFTYHVTKQVGVNIYRVDDG